MPELERTLTGLAGDIEYPPTPALADAVGRQLRAESGGRPFRWRPAVAIALGAVLLPAAAVAAVTPVRNALLELVGIRGVEVERAPRLSTPPSGGGLDLGAPVTLAGAERLTDYRLVTPKLPGLGSPEEVRLRGFPPGGAVSFVYRPRPGTPRASFTRRGLLLTEFRGSDAHLYVSKVLGPGSSSERVAVNGEPGVWLAGRPHRFAYLDARKRYRTGSIRLAGATLLWQRGPLTLRLEGAASKAAALRIADAVR